jgi:hypothetical protein
MFNTEWESRIGVALIVTIDTISRGASTQQPLLSR